MPKPSASELKPLPYGEGSIGWDPTRGKITLRHLYNGKSYVERGDTRAEVIAKRNRRWRDIDVRADLIAEGFGSVATMLNDWLSFEGKGKAPQTVRSYEWSVDHMTKHLGQLTTTELSVAHIETMYVALIDESMAAASMTKLRSHLKMACDFGMRRNYLPQDVDLVRRAKMPAGGTRYPRKKKWFTLVEFEIVRQHLVMDRGPRHALFLTMLLTGLRPSEAAGLRWEHVDLMHRVLHVEGAIQRQETWTGLYTETLKTDHRGDQARREIPIASDLKLVLEWLYDRADSEYVFAEAGKFLGFQAIADTARAIATDTGVKYINPNGYRHTFASVCRHHGMPYEQLAKLMGHKDARQIIQTYGHPIVATEPVDTDRYLGTSEG